MLSDGVGQINFYTIMYLFQATGIWLLLFRNTFFQTECDDLWVFIKLQASPHLQDSQQVNSDFADPNLQGEFEEDEMQVMAYLAKECLLLDPDSRPSMSEVVQILSTIAPDQKSKRKNFLGNSFKVWILKCTLYLTARNPAISNHSNVIENRGFVVINVVSYHF